ncbi:MAG: DUF4443 domain-containing protein [Candidatus Helarchaeota archaeon]
MEIFKSLADRRGPGHLFSLAHFYLVLKYLKEEKKPIGRYDLGKRLNLGSGSIRTVLKRLASKGLIESEKTKGHKITENGLNVLNAIGKYILKIQELENVGDLSVSNINIGCHVRYITNLIESGIRIRDEAIKYGADGVTTLIFKDDNFEIVGLDQFDIKRDYIELYRELIDKFEDIKDDDLIIIGTAQDKNAALIGVLNAIFSLLMDMKLF